MGIEAESIPVKDIIVLSRARKDPLEHLAGLAESIRVLGLLQPLVVNSRNELIAGGRRLEAVKRLGWEMVPVRRVDRLDDALLALQAERDENSCRSPMSMTEMTELGKMIEAMEKPAALDRVKAGKKPQGNLPQGKPGRTRDKVAKALGISGKTYEKAKKVVAAAEKEPEKFAGVVEEMDRTGKVDPAFKKVQEAEPVKAPAVVADAVKPPEETALTDPLALLGCAFCGGRGEHVEFLPGHFLVRCQHDNGFCPADRPGDSPEEAAQRWNRRPK